MFVYADVRLSMAFIFPLKLHVHDRLVGSSDNITVSSSVSTD